MKLTIEIINLNDGGTLYLDSSHETDMYPDMNKGEINRLKLAIKDIVNQISFHSEMSVSVKQTLDDYNGDKVCDLVANWTGTNRGN